MWARFLLNDDEVRRLQERGVPFIRTATGHVWVPESREPDVRTAVGRTVRAFRRTTGRFEPAGNGWGELVLSNLLVPMGCEEAHVLVRTETGTGFFAGLPSGARSRLARSVAVFVAPGLPGRGEVTPAGQGEFGFVLDGTPVSVPIPEGSSAALVTGPRRHPSLSRSATFVRDDEGRVIGAAEFLTESRIPVFYFPFPITAPARPETNWLPARTVYRIVHRVLAAALREPGDDPPPEHRRREPTQEEIAALADAMARSRASGLDRSIASRRAEYEEGRLSIDRLNEELSRTIHHSVELSREIAALEAARDHPVADENEIARARQLLAAHSLLETIRIEESGMEFVTGRLFLRRDSEGNEPLPRPIPLGCFTVTARLGERVRITSDDPVQVNGAILHHPHVREGYLCLGNAEAMVAGLLAERDFFGVVQVLLNYLQGYNSLDTFGRTNFPHFLERVQGGVRSPGDLAVFRTLLDVAPVPRRSPAETPPEALPPEPGSQAPPPAPAETDWIRLLDTLASEPPDPPEPGEEPDWAALVTFGG